MSRAAQRHRRGFTLVEALTAGMILTISATVLGTATRVSMQSLQLARDYERATELLDRVLTKIDLIGPERMFTEGPTEGEFDGPNAKFRWEATIESRLGGHLYEVTARVLWPTDGSERSVQAATLLNDPPDSRNPNLEWDQI